MDREERVKCVKEEGAKRRGENVMRKRKTNKEVRWRDERREWWRRRYVEEEEGTE